MIIAIPTDNKTLDSGVHQSFGRAPHFLIFDSKTEEAAFIDNDAATSRGGAGIRAAQAIVDKKVSVLIVPRLGQNAADVLKSAEIEIYKSMEGSVKDNVDAFIAGKLSLLKEIHAGFHNHA